MNIRIFLLGLTVVLGACSENHGVAATGTETGGGGSGGGGTPRETLSVTRAGSGFGTVRSSPAGINCGSTCSAEFDRGTLVTLSAVPDSEQQFDGFGGACAGASPCTVTMDAAKSVTATFSPIPMVLMFYEAGSAKRDISPNDADIAGTERQPNGDPQFFNLGGYGTRDLICDPVFNLGCVLSSPGPATGRYEPTSIRAMVLKRGTTMTAFVNIDAIGAGNIILANLRDAISNATGIPRDNILIAETHSHSAADLQGLWGGVPQRWRNFLYQQAAEAVLEARNNLEPANLVVASRRIDMNNYRREGGDDPASPTARYVTDKTLTVLQARALFRDAVLGTMTQFTAHPTVLGASNRLVHTDYALSMHDRLEQTYGGTSVYFNGVIADASPKTPTPDASFTGVERDYERARLMGVALADEARTALDTGTSLPVADIFLRTTTVILPVTNPLFLGAGGLGSFDGYYNFTDPSSGQSGFVATRVSRVRLGRADNPDLKLEIVSIPGEATGPFGATLRGRAGGRFTMLCGLTQNTLGYILPADEFGRMGNNYEETVSLGAQTAPLLEQNGYAVLFNEALPTVPSMD